MSKKGNPTYAVGVLKIQDQKGRGWSEQHNLKGATYADAHVNLAKIINDRAILLAHGLFIKDWSISDPNKVGDGFVSTAGVTIQGGYNISTDTAGPPIVLEACNDLESCIVARLQTGTSTISSIARTGYGLTVKIPGIRDRFFGDRVLLGSLVIAVNVLTARAAVSHTMTMLDALSNYLVTLLQTTTFVRNTFVPSPGDPTNAFRNFVKATVYENCGNKKIGRDPTAHKGRIRRAKV